MAFFEYIITAQGIKVNPSKIKAIKSWHTPTFTHDVWSFHGLASFYKRFIQNFSSITTLLINYIKWDKF